MLKSEGREAVPTVKTHNSKEGNTELRKKAGAELSQAQVNLKVTAEVGVEVGVDVEVEGDFQTCPAGGGGVDNEINAISAFN